MIIPTESDCLLPAKLLTILNTGTSTKNFWTWEGVYHTFLSQIRFNTKRLSSSLLLLYLIFTSFIQIFSIIYNNINVWPNSFASQMIWSAIISHLLIVKLGDLTTTSTSSSWPLSLFCSCSICSTDNFSWECTSEGHVRVPNLGQLVENRDLEITKTPVLPQYQGPLSHPVHLASAPLVCP